MSDLVEQCRDAFDSDNPAYKNLALRKCADRIEALERELAAAKEREGRMREALTPFTEAHAMGDNYVKFAPRLIIAARTALSDGGGDV